MSSFHSLCAREFPDNRTTRPHVLPLYLTSSFDFESIDQGIRVFAGEEEGHFYTRYGNPTSEVTASKIAALEVHGTDIQASGLMFSSGMSALHCLVLSLLRSGDRILTQGNLYGGSTELLKDICDRSGIEAIFMDLSDYEKVEEVIKADPSIKLLFFETPANPTLQCYDIQTLTGIAHRHGLKAAVDNTFATPFLQKPFTFGADFILHSTTKYLNGHGNAIAGVIVGRDAEFIENDLWKTMKLAGTQAGTMDSWLTYQGMKTLAVRMERHCSNAQQIAEYLSTQPRVKHVNYIGLPSHPDHAVASTQMEAFGGMLSFEVDGGLDGGIDFMRKIRFMTLAPTLGDIDTLVLHPASMSHLNIPREMREANGITDGLIRISVGIEDSEDIIADIDQALAQ